MESKEIEEEERLITAMAGTNFTYMSAEMIKVITWERVKEAASNSSIYQELLALIKVGLTTSKDEWPVNLHLYSQFCINLQIIDDLVFCVLRD